MNARAKRTFSALVTVSVLTVTVLGIVGLTALPVSAQNHVVLSGQTTGNLNERLSYSATVQDCRETAGGQLTKDCDPVPGGTVQFRFVSPTGGTAVQSVTTNSLGVASTSFTPNLAGNWQISATSAGVTSNTVLVTVTAAGGTSPTPNPTGASPTATDGNGQPSASTGGDGKSSAAPLLSEEGIADIAAQAETATGLGSNWLLIVLAVIIIVILAIIATALLMRRRGGD